MCSVPPAVPVLRFGLDAPGADFYYEEIVTSRLSICVREHRHIFVLGPRQRLAPVRAYTHHPVCLSLSGCASRSMSQDLTKFNKEYAQLR